MTYDEFNISNLAVPLRELYFHLFILCMAIKQIHVGKVETNLLQS